MCVAQKKEGERYSEHDDAHAAARLRVGLVPRVDPAGNRRGAVVI